MMYEKIAIIGMAGRFPGAKNPNELFYNCLDGINSIRRLSEDEIKHLGKTPGKDGYVPYYSTISDIDKFDHQFFGMTAHEAELTDPQQRIFLECSWAAMEDAGYAVDTYKGKAGVFGSCSINSYFLNHIWGNVCTMDDFQYPVLIGADKDFLCTRVSYKLGLTGPSMTIQNACSSSLASFHVACQCLRNREADMALAGGVSINVPDRTGYTYTEGGPQSEDGVCRPFDDRATGMIPGNGCGVVVLKRLKDALQAHDHIYAIVNTSAAGNDGRNKVGFTAPSIVGQTETIREAFRHTDITPEAVSFIEAHGTGTRLGDPIEVRALSKVYGQKQKNSCALGSVKANIGHLDAAAGITGVIKVALSLHNRIITQNINYETPNRQIDFDHSPFFVNKSNIRFSKNEKKYAALNSLGMGGTNVHCILESYMPDEDYAFSEQEKSWIIPFSAQSAEALQRERENLEQFFRKGKNDSLSMADIAYTLCYGRNVFKCRDYIIAASPEGASGRLNGKKPKVINPIGEKWKNGEFVDWESEFAGVEAHRASIPTYPFERISHWIEASPKKGNTRNSQTEGVEDGLSVIDSLTALWSKHLKVDGIHKDDDFFELDGDSLLAIYLIKDINDSYKTSFTFEDLLDYPTPEKIAGQIKIKRKKHPDNFHLMTESFCGNQNLFLVHPAGGHVFCYKMLSEVFEGSYNFYAISYPKELKKARSLAEIALYYYEQIRSVQEAGPYLIGGYSFGGNLTYEIAKIMEKNGEKNKVILIDSLVPTAYTLSAGMNNYMKCFPMVLDLTFGNTPFTLSEYEQRYGGLGIQEIVKKLTEEKRIPDRLPIDSAEQFFDTWVSNHEALCTQEKEARIASDILLFYCRERTPGDLVQAINMKEKPYYTWKEFSGGAFKAVEVKGNHFNVLEQRDSIKQIADEIGVFI